MSGPTGVGGRAERRRDQSRRGESVGHYELLEELGHGGMGVVYRARDLSLRREVALKRPTPGLSDDAVARDRFLREARAAARLSHPHIVPIFEVFESSGTPWIAMQLVAGQTLRDALRSRRPLPIDQTLAHAEGLADALHAAHGQRVLHRDLKPGNIILGTDGRALLTDFGLARYFVPPDEISTTSTKSEPATGPGAIVGTPAYMSPEQALGHPADERSDIFSLGTVLYEMCTGCQAFAAPSRAGMLDSVLHHEPVSIARLNYEVPEDFERIVRKCLAKDPGERYQTVRDLLADVRTVRRRVEHESYARVHPDVVQRRRVRRVIRVLAWAGLAAALIAAAIVLPPRFRAHRGGSGGRNLSVASFQNLDGDPGLDYFSRGLTETLISRLSGLEGVYVAPAGKEAGGDLILQGGVQKSGDRVRITYRIVRRVQNRTLGGNVVEGKVGDIFALQDDVARGVAGVLARDLGLEVRVTPAEAPTRNISAFDFYLRGRDYRREYDRPSALDSALDLFRKSLALDPTFALAHAGLGEALWRKYEATSEARLVPEARGECEQALRLDPRLAVAHVCLGTVHNGLGQYEEAGVDFLEAIGLDATNDDAYRGLGVAHESLGKPDQAEAALRKAIALHPDYWAGYTWLGSFYSRHARYGEAASQFERAIALAPDNAAAYRSLGGVYHLLGRDQEAITALERSIQISPSFKSLSNLGTIYFARRRFADAVRTYERCTRFDDVYYITYGNLARALYWAPGRRAEAAPIFTRAAAMAATRLTVNPSDGDAQIMLAFYNVMIGNRQEAQTRLTRALALQPDNPEYLFWAGVVHAQLQERGPALDAIDRSAALGYPIGEFRDTIELDDLRGEPRFKAVVDGR